MSSCIRSDKIYALSQNIVIKKFGSVKDNILGKITEEINSLIDRNEPETSSGEN